MLAVRPLLAASMPITVSSLAPRESIHQTPACLDRRGGPRGRGAPRIVDAFTAASHRPLPLTFAVGANGHWALMTGISCSPHGVLLRALDPRDAALEAPRLDVTAAWRRLGTRLGVNASPLWFSTVCIGAQAFVAAMAELAIASPLELTVVVLDGGPGVRDRILRGVLVPLSDPSPQVLGIALPDDELRRLEAAAADLQPPTAKGIHATPVAGSLRRVGASNVSDITGEAAALRELGGRADVSSPSRPAEVVAPTHVAIDEDSPAVAVAGASRPRRARRRGPAKRAQA